ncbi:MAG: uncharacterized protein KVP18_004083 [Porospora cf. gigantea A]|uniref:uncharacterized protein n=1 Tax=Porospora cf. gigantea A TaxID=2853593 RepID=UPI00355A7ECF|nr:MAG: hypothetical protein KVP18_004083 [Porospora cf. gigantea A]
MGNVHIADAEDRRNYIDGKVVETVYYRCLFLIPNTSVCLHLRTTSSPSVCLEAIQQKLQEISRAGRLPMYTFDQPIPEPRVAGRQNRAVEYPTRKTPVEQTTENVCVGHWEHSADRVQLTICDPQVPGQTVLLHRVVLRLSNVTSKQRWVPSGRMSIVEFESNGVAHDVSDTRHFNCFRFSSVFEWRHLQWNRNSFF